MKEKSIGFIGGGRVTRVILGGLAKKDIRFGKVTVSDLNEGILLNLKEKFPEVEVFANDNRTPASAGLVFLALHPPAVPEVLKEIRGSLQADSILISLAPKIRMAKISEILGGFSRIVRMIPNAPSIVNAGYNPVVFGAGISQQEKDELMRLFSALGVCPEVKEETLEAYAVLTGMGPTYFWFQWEELTRLGVSFGMDPAEARKAIYFMIEGAAKTLFHSNLNPEDVMDLIPVKPLTEEEVKIREAYQSRLEALYKKLTS
ncbi:MAG: pyrroline-5-carboxylate reductase family protein [Candidatus Aminicenantales bacterium]